MSRFEKRKKDRINHMDVGQKIHTYYGEGFHCAEAIALAITDAWSSVSAVTIQRAASGFCGGIGRCREDACGALTGGVIALSTIFGRDSGDENIDDLCTLAATFRARFIDQFKSTVCSRIQEEIRSREDIADCEDLTSQTGVILSELISEYYGRT